MEDGLKKSHGMRTDKHRRPQTEAIEEDDAGPAWPKSIANEWADDLSDPRQDIYTVDDGTEPGQSRGTEQ